MEKINDNYYIESDSNNIILYKKKIYGANSKNEGEEYFDTVGYYSTISSLYKSLMEKEIKDDLGIIKNIKYISDRIDNNYNNLKKRIKELN